ncbi:MAG TPA: kelch repeat-containing protein [Ktedonobacterales bacterium]|nr:kelch repeat-containing protein [Ktedonobacterales bacterium]
MRNAPAQQRSPVRLGTLFVLALLAAGASACAPTAATVPTTATPTPTLLPGSAGRIASTARMSVQRADHTATLLPNGTVLIAGGCTGDSCEPTDLSKSTEVYDPATGQFRRSGDMLTLRSGDHTATLLPSGKVLIAGGWSGNTPTANAELYDPVSRTFALTGAMTALRAGQTATLLDNGRVLFTGGYDGSQRLASAEVYDPQTGAFSVTGTMITARSEHAAARLLDGRVLIIGGSKDRTTVQASAEIYDPATGRFARTGDMTVVRHKHAAVTLPDGRVLVIGGSDGSDSEGFNLGRYASTEIYDPARGAFTASATMSAARYKLPTAVAQLASGDVLVAGDSPRAEVYDVRAGGFRLADGSLGASWSFTTVTPLRDGTALIVGGYDTGIHLTPRAWIFHPAE